MKRIEKTIATLLTALVLTSAALLGCAAAPEKAQTSEKKTVGVLQLGSHPSLDNCYQGIAEALSADETITIDLENGNFDTATCDVIAKNMAAKNVDLIVAIATPAAVSAYAAAANTKIPVVFSAVSDPVKAGLVDDVTAPGGNCTGTSDVLDLAAQLTLIRTLQPEAATIGILYTTSEANSVSQLAELETIAPEYGFTVVSTGVQTAADIPAAAASLCGKVDCINNFTDNNVVNNLSILLTAAETAGIPVYGSEEEQVKNGCLAAVSIDYVALGRTTGEMANEVLAGADPAKMAVKRITEAVPVINSDVLSAFGIELPAAYEGATLVVTNAG